MYRCSICKILTEKLQNCDGFVTMHCYLPFLKFQSRQRIFVQFRQRHEAFINTYTRRFKIQTSDMRPPPGRVSASEPTWDTNMVARNQQRHQVFTFAIIKNAFFLLVSKLAFTETSSVLFKMYKLLKIIRRQLIFKQTSLLRLLLIVVSHTVKIRKFKMLYFQNERCYRAENFYKDLFFSPLQRGIHKNSEGLAILTTSQ